MIARITSRPAAALLLALAVVLPIAGCGSASTNIVGPTPTSGGGGGGGKCQITIASAARNFPADGGSGSVTISTDRECSWTATSDSNWLAFTASASGQGSGTLAFSVAPNTAITARSAALQVNDQRLQVSEDGAPCKYQLDRASESVPAAGGAGSVAVTTLLGCTWSASSNAPWVSVSTGPFSGSASVSMTISRNTAAARSTTLSVAGTPFTVQQQSGVVPPPPDPAPAPPPAPTPPPLPPPAPAPCTYSIAPASQSAGAAGGSSSVTVETAAGCAWTAISQATWLTVDTSGGVGGGTATVTVAPNTTISSRTGTVVVAGQTFTITQAGLPPVDVVGEVSMVRGSCPTLTFVVSKSSGSVTVLANDATSFTGGSCGDVRAGARVHVTGVQDVNGSVTATVIQIQKAAND